MTMTTTTPSSSSCKTRIVVTADLSKKTVAKKVLPSLSDQLCAYLISHGFCEVVMVLDDNARPPTKKKRGRPPKKQPPKPAAAATAAATPLQKIVVTITDKGEVTTSAVEIDKEEEEAAKAKSIESSAVAERGGKKEVEGDDDDTATEIPVAVEVEEGDESSPATTKSKKGNKKSSTPTAAVTKKRKRPPTRASPAASLKKLESPGRKKATAVASPKKPKTAKAAPKKATSKTTTAAKKDPPLTDVEATSTEEDAAAVEPPNKKAKVSSQQAKKSKEVQPETTTTKEPNDSFPAAEALKDEKGASGEDGSAPEKTTTAASGKLKDPPAAAASTETEREKGAAAAAAAAEGEQQPAKKKARKKSPKQQQGDEGGGGGETTLGKRELQWNAKFDELKEFKAQHGHCNVPNSHSKELHSWVDRQQSAKRAGKLRKDRQERMTALGIEWEDYLFGDHHNTSATGEGNGAVAGGGEAGGAAAGATASATGAAATIGKRELQWNNRFEELKKFKEEHGHCNVPTTHSKDLHAWVDRQRQVKRTGKIRKDRQEKLSSLGFVWEITNHYWNKQVGPPGDAAAAGGGDNKNGGDPSKGGGGGEVIGRRDASWNRKFQMLKDFRKEMGHCNVPANHKELGDWIHQQRKAYKVGTLKRHRKELMDALDFEWDSKKGFQQHKFEIRFEELQQFIAENGHCKVPRSQRVLSDWVDCQRRMWRNGTLKPEREARLNTLGCFEWQTAKSFVFEDRFQQLIQYHAENGHFNVPKSYPLLGEWVHYQRQAKKQGILKEQSIARLNEIGFRW